MSGAVLWLHSRAGTNRPRRRPTVMRLVPFLVLLAGIAGCASVKTDVLLFGNTPYPPTTEVEILDALPSQPHVRIAMIEARGDVGVSEVEVLARLRDRARQLGADALVRAETREVYQAPVRVYEPYYDPFFYPRRFYPYRYQPFGPPWGSYRWVGGGYHLVVKATAIRYDAVTP